MGAYHHNNISVRVCSGENRTNLSTLLFATKLSSLPNFCYSRVIISRSALMKDELNEFKSSQYKFYALTGNTLTRVVGSADIHLSGGYSDHPKRKLF